MEIKDLNKRQLILLALLLSFVASIATSITTVTLMQQAPTSVTVPINRVIQQTVEKIQQVEGKTTVQTVVVKEEDLVVDALEKNRSSVFVITKETTDDGGSTVTETSAGRGLVLNSDGILVVDGSMVPDKGVYYAKNDSGKFKLSFIAWNKDGFSFVKLGEPLDVKNKLAFTVPSFGDIDKMKAGQKILFLGANISTFVFDGNKDIRVNANKANSAGAVLNLNGEVIGIALEKENSSFVSSNSILKALESSVPKTP